MARSSVAACSLALLAVACGSSGKAAEPLADAGHEDHGDAGHDAGHDAGADSGCADDAGGGRAIVGLTIKNYQGGCSVTVNGATLFTGPDLVLCQPSGTVDLSATANPRFVVGSDPWHDTTTADGASATVTVTAGAKCVWVCCPAEGAGAACPMTDQCP